MGWGAGLGEFETVMHTYRRMSYFIKRSIVRGALTNEHFKLKLNHMEAV